MRSAIAMSSRWPSCSTPRSTGFHLRRHRPAHRRRRRRPGRSVAAILWSAGADLDRAHHGGRRRRPRGDEPAVTPAADAQPVGQTDRFKAAVMGAGISDWGMLAATGGGSSGWEGTGPHRHDRLSPILYASGVRTPVLILSGAVEELRLRYRDVSVDLAALSAGPVRPCPDRGGRDGPRRDARRCAAPR
jgi:hypothetical protein